VSGPGRKPWDCTNAISGSLSPGGAADPGTIALPRASTARGPDLQRCDAFPPGDVQPSVDRILGPSIAPRATFRDGPAARRSRPIGMPCLPPRGHAPDHRSGPSGRPHRRARSTLPSTRRLGDPDLQRSHVFPPGNVDPSIGRGPRAARRLAKIPAKWVLRGPGIPTYSGPTSSPPGTWTRP
jgi:hypothetical protein